jgi:hypothetical protein
VQGGLSGFFDLQPSSEGVAKLVAQVDYLLFMIGSQERLKVVVDHFEVDLAQLAFFHGSTPYKPTRRRLLPADKLTLFFVFGPVDFAGGKTPIESGKRRVLSRAGRPISNPNNNDGQPHEDDQ